MYEIEVRKQNVCNLESRGILTKEQMGFANTILNIASSLDNERLSWIEKRGWHNKEQEEMMNIVSDMITTCDEYIKEAEEVYYSIPR